ncbi:hypothetical protein ACTSEZ_07490 [Metabacillus sp. JX24]|uniref:hypothetical protein n=1 Tax=Metabacillus sp. JX24 TaxID=3240759 RepID=UPI00350F4C16
MKKRWLIWLLSIPAFMVIYLESFFTEGNALAYNSQAECIPKFIFTPKTVQYCSEVYPIDVFLIALKNPLSYICIILGFFIIFYPVFRLSKSLLYRPK